MKSRILGVWKAVVLLLIAGLALAVCAPRDGREEGKIRVEEIGVDADGMVYQRTYLRGNEILFLEIDRNRNGKFDYWSYWYKGAPAWMYADSNEDGEQDFWMVMDPSGKPVLAVGDADGDGKPDDIRIEDVGEFPLVP